MTCCIHVVCTDTARDIQVLSIVDPATGVVTRYDLPDVTAFAGTVADLDCSNVVLEQVDALGADWDAANANWIDPATVALGDELLVFNVAGTGTKKLYRGTDVIGAPQWKDS